MEGVKVGDVVVVVEAYPPVHNGDIGTVFSIYAKVAVTLHSTNYRWICTKVRPATLLERELADV